MIFTIVIVLIVALLVIAIMINAVQQHKEKIESERRVELAKQKTILDETEDVIMVSANIPTSSGLMQVLNKRVLGALKVMHEMDPKASGIKARLAEVEERVKSSSLDGSQGDENIQLPDSEKQIIVFIQCLKKQRALLRSEHSRGKVDSQTFTIEDKRLDKMQLRVNIDTLNKRAGAAMKSGMMGSARQYYEKAVAALNAFANQDEYTRGQLARINAKLVEIQETLTRSNAEDRAKRAEEERDELDELFAPKKKW
jgi:hypothetical protein